MFDGVRSFELMRFLVTLLVKVSLGLCLWAVKNLLCGIMGVLYFNIARALLESAIGGIDGAKYHW